jgi:molecular chaperone HscA
LHLLDQVITLDRPTFESIIQVALDRTISVCKRVLRDAKLELSDIQNVVFVGGSTRSYAVQKVVAEVFHKSLYVPSTQMKWLQLAQQLLPIN